MIKSEKEYKAILERIEELLAVAENVEDPEAKGFIELNLLSDLVADYEEVHFPISPPTLSNAIKTSNARAWIEPTLKIAREISRKLDIEASIVLRV